MPTEASSSSGATTQLHGEDFKTAVNSSVPPSSYGSVEAEEAKDTREETEEEVGLAAMRNRAAAIQQAMREHDDLCLSTALGKSVWLGRIAFILHRADLQACELTTCACNTA